ncbi:hypothetical protein [Metalysinibacillus jejuensis]|uniref:hypothetical protein n=1 Tax=Metalysinibacillus jejuensis TaxID=914327 RepID=UPI000D33183A|nr:hypothetical protein [Metalysinibacillus jejuensis]
MSNKYIDVERSLMRFCVLVACEKRLCVCATSGTEEKTLDFVELEDEMKKTIAEQNAIFEVSSERYGYDSM